MRPRLSITSRVRAVEILAGTMLCLGLLALPGFSSILALAAGPETPSLWGFKEMIQIKHNLWLRP